MSAISDYKTAGGINYSQAIKPVAPVAAAVDVAKDVPWYKGVGSALTVAAPVVGAATGIIDTIFNIYSSYEASKQEEKNRKLAEGMYNQQRADEQENLQYNRGIAERNFQYGVSENRASKKEAQRQDNYNKYVDYVNRFTSFLNSEQGSRLRNAQSLRSL